MTLTPDMMDLIATFPLGFVATVTAEGKPTLSPKGTFLALDTRTIAFGDIRSPGTLRNLAQNPHVEVNFIDQWKRKGIRVAGHAALHPKGSARYDILHPKWVSIWGDLADRIRTIVEIDVTAAKLVTTPPYDTGATEEEMIALYKSKFAEIYP